MLTVENTALVIVDVQGKLAQLMSEKETLFANLERMIKGALALDIPIIWAEQLPDKLGPTIPEITNLLPDRQPIAKATFSCGGCSEFNAALDTIGRNQILVVGVETHICVYQTAIELLDRGLHVEVVSDAVGSRITENKAVGLNKMQQYGAKLTSTEMALFELMRTAEHRAFREIQKIVK